MTRMDLIRKRKDCGRTQSEVAEGCGMSRQYYSFIESGKRNISVKAAKKLAAYYGFDWKELFEEEEKSP